MRMALVMDQKMDQEMAQEVTITLSLGVDYPLVGRHQAQVALLTRQPMLNRDGRESTRV